MKPRRFPRSFALGAAVTGVLLTGCGGAADDAAKPADPDQPVRAEVPSEPGTIAMKDVKFVPERLTIKVGETVTWRNDESLDHNVVAQKGENFRSRAFGEGGTYTFTARKPGTIDYVCNLHPGMDGQLIVAGR